MPHSPRSNSGQIFSRKTLVLCLILFSITEIVYLPVWHGQFLWDDEFLVLRNSFIRSPSLALEAFRHFLFTDTKGEFYRPVQNISYMLDYWRAGLDSDAFHGTNIFIHALNGILVFFLTRKLFQRFAPQSEFQTTFMAFCLAAAWLLHPVHSAIVAYVSGRADSLALAGLLGSWLCWETAQIASHENKKGETCIFSCFAFALALTGCCAKEIALAGLSLFVLHIWLFREEMSNQDKGKATLAIFVICGGYLLLRQLPDPNVAPSTGEIVTWPEKLHLFLRATGDYTRLFVYPSKLFMERQVSVHTGLFTDPVANDTLFPYLGWLGGTCIIGLGYSLFWKGAGSKLRSLGVLWFGIMILPVSNLFTLNATVAEHWLYIPSIGLCFWLAGCWLDAGKNLQRIAVLFLPVAIVCLGLRSYKRAEDWKDGFTFYRATIRSGGDSIRIRINLAGEYEKMNKLEQAETLYESILRAVPNFSMAKVLLVQNLSKQQRTAETDKLSTSNAATTGVTTAKMARQSYAANPNSWPMAKALIKIYKEQNQPQAALLLLKGFTQRNWWNAEAQNALGEICAAQNDFEGALLSYQMAARLDIRNAEPLTQAAIILAEKGEFSQAIAMQEKAINRENTRREWEVLDSIKQLQAENLPKP